ncbi:unnamed protein product [Linum trigynum]|uniref:Uncharacterized protein n=1 Tax=Linum trigynum TaxID=586398 RepID=A0AAV2FQI9_9ROSI
MLLFARGIRHLSIVEVPIIILRSRCHSQEEVVIVSRSYCRNLPNVVVVYPSSAIHICWHHLLVTITITKGLKPTIRTFLALLPQSPVFFFFFFSLSSHRLGRCVKFLASGRLQVPIFSESLQIRSLVARSKLRCTIIHLRRASTFPRKINNPVPSVSTSVVSSSMLQSSICVGFLGTSFCQI